MKYLWKIESQNETTGEIATDVFIVDDDNDISNFKDERQQLALKEIRCDSSTKWKEVETTKRVRPIRIYNLFSKSEAANKQDYHRLIWSLLLHNATHSVSMRDVDKIFAAYTNYTGDYKEVVRALKKPLGQINGDVSNILCFKNEVLYLGEGENIISSDNNINAEFFKLDFKGFQNHSVSSDLWLSNLPEDELLSMIDSKKPICYYYGTSDDIKVYTLNELNDKKKNITLMYLTNEDRFNKVEMISSFLSQIVTRHNKQKKYIFDIFMLLAEKYEITIDSKNNIKQAVSSSSWNNLTELFKELLYYSEEKYYIVIGDVPDNKADDVLSWVDSLSKFANICQIIVSLNKPPRNVRNDVFAKKHNTPRPEFTVDAHVKQDDRVSTNNQNINTSISAEERIKLIAQDNNVYKAIMMATFLKAKSFKITADLVFDELNRFAAEKLAEKSDHIIECSPDKHIIFTGDEGVYSYLKTILDDDNSTMDHFIKFCIRTISNGNYRGMAVADLLQIRDFYMSNVDQELKEDLSYKFIRFEIYTILALWDGNDSYLKYFETKHHISYWVDNTDMLFDHISSEYMKLDSKAREELRIQFLKAKQRVAYSQFYSGKVESAISYLEEIRDSNPDLYGSHYQFTFSISDSLAWWNRNSHPEKSLDICESFIEYAKSLGFSLEDYALGVMSHYKCIMLYNIGVKNNDTRFFSEASDYALQLLAQLDKKAGYNENSKNKLYGKIRIILVQALCREKKYEEAIEYCEKEIKSREQYKDGFYYHNALLTLCKIHTYNYRDTNNENSYVKASELLSDLLNRIEGIKLSGVKLVYADLIEYRYEKTGDAPLLNQTYDLIVSALKIANEWNGERCIDYIAANKHLSAFKEKYPHFQSHM